MTDAWKQRKAEELTEETCQEKDVHKKQQRKIDRKGRVNNTIQQHEHNKL